MFIAVNICRFVPYLKKTHLLIYCGKYSQCFPFSTFCDVPKINPERIEFTFSPLKILHTTPHDDNKKKLKKDFCKLF